MQHERKSASDSFLETTIGTSLLVTSGSVPLLLIPVQPMMGSKTPAALEVKFIPLKIFWNLENLKLNKKPSSQTKTSSSRVVRHKKHLDPLHQQTTLSHKPFSLSQLLQTVALESSWPWTKQIVQTSSPKKLNSSVKNVIKTSNKHASQNKSQL